MRFLCILARLSASAEFVWDQFDGITRPPQSKFESFKRFIRWPTRDYKWFEHYEHLALWLMPDWEGLCLDPQRATRGSAEDALTRALHVYNCITRFFLNADGREFNKDDVAKVIA